MSSRLAPRHVRVFLASPGDVIEERRLGREVLQQLERSPLVREDFTIEVVSWDDPDGPVPMLATLTPQQSVTRARPRPSECDLTVVIVAGRLGTPLDDHKPDGTPYRSGTEWEFEDAKKAGKPILLYRRTEPTPVSGDDIAEAARQRRRVDEFFTQFTSPTGSLTGGVTTYRTAAEFAARLRTDVETILRDLPRIDAAVGDQDPPAGAKWIGRTQWRVRRWHYGRLLMLLMGGFAITAIAWTAFATFSSVLEDHEASPLAHAVRYLVLSVGVVVPLLLLVLTWWWLVPDRSRPAGTR